ncbi:gamma-glutamyltransferase [Ferruginibacter sp. HRS2-29]|uniref:gamma-glutamyltransferase n=1 Tax=Ferruginibacter sp. HRS2-29 TaxID=2487334 RepID=UPI0020CFDEE2|nr:gamma-glutamyltransferase [Ferruginibacter sp. HRS2-29]MCP9752241.1 gamma-glutamyltransferase [Ferruginibacter sp. HRS2-29]
MLTPRFVSFSFFILFSGVTGFAQQHTPYNYTIQKEITCSKGAVASAHPLASKAGVDILKKGGNAVDAAIATQLALAVVYPGAGNIGGGGFLIAHLKNGRNIALDYREKAPKAASRDMYLDSAGNPNLDKSQYGHLAAGVPGTVAGLFASMPYAKLPFADLVAPAIELAEKGFVITKSQAASFNSAKTDFLKYNTGSPAFVKDSPWKEGDTLFQKDLANTLKRIRDLGQKGFYEGETARLIVEEMKRSNGIISLEDLKEYRAVERKVIDFDYKGYRIITMPLPSSGGIILEQMMKMIEKRNIGAMKFQSPASVQLITEIERRAYADRANFLGDPDFVKVPVKTMVSEVYLRERMHDFVPGKAGSSDSTKAGLIDESKETTHLSVTDSEGNAVSVTTTLNGGYGSKTVVSGAGFLLNNEMDDFSVKPGVPNMYGAVGNEKNAIAPGKRMLSSMTPTIVLKNNAPYLVVGTPGGTTIPTSVFQTLVNVLEFNMSPSDAVNKPKFHHQWLPDQVYLEKGFSETTKNALIKMGYKVTEIPQIGRVELIRIGLKPSKKMEKIFSAVADHRGDDAAEGY